MRFQAPQLGALGVTFTALRFVQTVSLIVIIGLVANFIDEITSAKLGVPDVMIGTITVVCKCITETRNPPTSFLCNT